MNDRLFDIGAPEIKKRVIKVPTAADIASGKAPIYEVTVGLTRRYVRAYGEEDAINAFLVKNRAVGMKVGAGELTARRLYHADIVDIIRLEPRLARKLRAL